MNKRALKLACYDASDAYREADEARDEALKVCLQLSPDKRQKAWENWELSNLKLRYTITAMQDTNDAWQEAKSNTLLRRLRNWWFLLRMSKADRDDLGLDDFQP